MNKFISFLFTLVLLSGCVTNPDYRNVSKDGKDLKATDVNFQVLGDFHRDPPDCVAVLDSKADKDPELGRQIAIALARHLGEKVDRVIFPRKRHALEREAGLDLKNQGDRRRFALKTRCRFYAVAELYDLGDDYVGVFAKKHVGVRIDLKRFQDDKILWQAAHTVWRADGGLPLSPIGAIGGIASAAAFSSDQEVMPSLIDDAMRRMVRTLPYTG